MARKQHEWRMTEREMIERSICRALRRDPGAGVHKFWVSGLANRIERGEIIITMKPMTKLVHGEPVAFDAEGVALS